jgi:hypothetical protein
VALKKRGQPWNLIPSKGHDGTIDAQAHGSREAGSGTMLARGQNMPKLRTRLILRVRHAGNRAKARKNASNRERLHFLKGDLKGARSGGTAAQSGDAATTSG